MHRRLMCETNCWRRRYIDPQRRFRLTQALLRESALGLRLREFTRVNESRQPSSIWRRRQHPGLLRRVPDHAPEAAARVTQGHDEQARPAVTVAARHARQRALAVVDLPLFARGELQPVELLRLALHQPAGEALGAVVAAGEAEPVDQVLVDRRVVAAQAQLGLDEGAMRFTQRLWSAVGCRWPGWENFSLRAGGRGGGICRYRPGGQGGGDWLPARSCPAPGGGWFCGPLQSAARSRAGWCRLPAAWRLWFVCLVSRRSPSMLPFDGRRGKVTSCQRDCSPVTGCSSAKRSGGGGF